MKPGNPSSIRSALLLKITTSFCSSLTQSPPPPPQDLIHRFFTSNKPEVTEHGPEWARSRLPFLSKTFEGREECVQYFKLLGETLSMEMGEGTFPKMENGEWVVDEEATLNGEDGEGKGIVSVVGKAKFSSLRTGKSWDEQFIYRFSGFDEEGKIGHWEIWADPLSAWVACEGQGKI